MNNWNSNYYYTTRAEVKPILRKAKRVQPVAPTVAKSYTGWFILVIIMIIIF